VNIARMLLDGHFRSAHWSLVEEPDQGDTHRAGSQRTHTRVKSSHKKELIESTPVKTGITVQQIYSSEYNG
jgi:hypothetical protein